MNRTLFEVDDDASKSKTLMIEQDLGEKVYYNTGTLSDQFEPNTGSDRLEIFYSPFTKT